MPGPGPRELHPSGHGGLSPETARLRDELRDLSAARTHDASYAQVPLTALRPGDVVLTLTLTGAHTFVLGALDVIPTVTRGVESWGSARTTGTRTRLLDTADVARLTLFEHEGDAPVKLWRRVSP